MTKRPNSRVNLDKAIMRLFGSYDKSLETRDIIANAIVGQMLCGAVVKGGSGLKLRYGMSCTRATVDLDTACSGDIPQFIDMLAARLEEGWNDFTGLDLRRRGKPRMDAVDLPQEEPVPESDPTELQSHLCTCGQPRHWQVVFSWCSGAYRQLHIQDGNA